MTIKVVNEELAGRRSEILQVLFGSIMDSSTTMDELVIVKKQVELSDQRWTLGPFLEQVTELLTVCQPLYAFDQVSLGIS